MLYHVRFLDENRFNAFFARSFEIDTKGETIFKEVITFFEEKNIFLRDIIACVTDGAPSMIGKYRDFIAYLKMLYLKYSVYTT